MKIDTIVCQLCSRKFHELQMGRCPYCNMLVDGGGKGIMFKLRAKSMNNAIVGIAQEQIVTEIELKEILCQGEIDDDSWGKLIPAGQVVIGAIKYEWENEAVDTDK